MQHFSIEKKKRIALVATIIIGVILIGVYILILISNKEQKTENPPRAPFKELYTTLIDTTQQYFSPEK